MNTNPLTTERYLLSGSSMQRFLSHVELRSSRFERSELIDAWRSARQAMAKVEDKEAGCADEAGILPMPSTMSAAVEALVASEAVSMAYNQVPVMFGLAEFDSIMCSRVALDDERVADYAGRLDGMPDDTTLVEMCLGLDATERPAAQCQWDGQRLQVVSEADDLRLLDARGFDGERLLQIRTPGIADAALQMTVGRMPAVMHAVHFDSRLLLVNGHHRARALRATGVTFMPCLISVCEHLDDVMAAAPLLPRAEVERAFSVPRPPMLADFDRSSLVFSYEARRLRRVVQLRVEVSSHWLP